MNSDGAWRDYDQMIKNRWRRWLWTRLLERTRGREQRWPTLYLPGPQDLDRAVAVEKGVPAANLIGVDRAAANVRGVRQAGGIGIVADVAQVLDAWPRQQPVAVIVLDFCGGLPRDAQLQTTLCREPFADAIVAINLLRGRDAHSNQVRVALQQSVGVSTLNRAAQFMAVYAAARCRYLVSRGLPAMTTQDVAKFLETTYAPQFCSYESGALTFDSVIYQPRILQPTRANFDAIERATTYKPLVKYLVGAALAVRTMRSTKAKGKREGTHEQEVAR